MKGTPEAPACGFSARTVAMLESLDQPFAAVNILPDPGIRQELSALSGWPTIPQLFVDGELVGGCDIVTEMYQTGELQKLLGIEGDAPAAVAPEAVSVARRRGGACSARDRQPAVGSAGADARSDRHRYLPLPPARDRRSGSRCTRSASTSTATGPRGVRARSSTTTPTSTASPAPPSCRRPRSPRSGTSWRSMSR